MSAEMAFLQKNVLAQTASCNRWRRTIFAFCEQWRSVADSCRAFSQFPAVNVLPGFGSLAQRNHSSSHVNKKATFYPLLYLPNCPHLDGLVGSPRWMCTWQNKEILILHTERKGAVLTQGQKYFYSRSAYLCSVDGRPEAVMTQECLHELAEQLIEELSKLDVMIKAVPLARAEQITINLHHCGFSSQEISSIITGHPKYFLSTKLVPCVQNLLAQGLLKPHVVSIVQNFEPVTCLKPAKIESVINVFRSFSFYEKSFSHVLATCPTVFLLAEKAITQRIQMLRELFTHADVVTVVRSSPHLLVDEWPDIHAKFNYVFHEMKITQKQMVYASLFSHSLQHVKSRHTFLVRAGFFDMSKRRENEKSPNASLDKIIDMGDEDFCRKFGGFSSEEYRVFCKLFEKERSLPDSDDEL